MRFPLYTAVSWCNYIPVCTFQTVIREACDFICYSNQLFYHDTVAKTKAFQHLHMYIHRIALSVILPPRVTPQEPSMPVSPLEGLVKGVASFKPGSGRRLATVDIGLDDTTTTTTSADTTTTTTAAALAELPLGASPGEGPGSTSGGGGHSKLTKHKSLGSTVSNSTSASPLLSRKRSSSFNLPTVPSSPSSSAIPTVSSSPAMPPSSSEGTQQQQQQLSKSAGKTRPGKSPLLKQQTLADIGPLKSLFSKTESVLSGGSDKAVGGVAADGGGAVGGVEGEWRGLKLDQLRSRIQRLVVLMNLSEPGTIPNPAILASLVDLVSPHDHVHVRTYYMYMYVHIHVIHMCMYICSTHVHTKYKCT